MNTSQHPERVNGAAPAVLPPRPTRAERLAADAAANARRADILDEAKRDRARRAEEWAAEREQLRHDRRRTRKTAQDDARRERLTVWQIRLQRWWHAFILVGAIVGVNIVAVVGQVTAFTAAKAANGFEWSTPQALATAAVIESIAIYVGWHAHVALIEGDSVIRLRLTSYTIALGVGVLNYHHYAPDWHPSDKAAMFGAASMLSPWLWAIHSRHQHRQDLRKAGLIDPRAPKFSALRWVLHRSETWRALRWAVRHSEQSPTAAILASQGERGLSNATRSVDRAHVALAAGRDALIRAQSAALAATETYVLTLENRVGELSQHDAIEAPQAEPVPDTSTDDVADTPDVSEEIAEAERERPDTQDNREAEKWIRGKMRAGRTPKQADIATKYGFSNGWASSRVKAARADLSAEGYRFLPGNVVMPPSEADTSADVADVSEADAEVSGDQS
ncbi:hypothetical protein ACGFNP_25035 [Nonomuraea sp. NPDC049269]|uniref:hypothetical protein n=1 Tax=Nonomuraea sp. NPDC049269 TaxID=3364349 RepID=UPI00371705FD